ncbi:MAG TPA: HEAT repeat domain-containing protein [Candidatus Polarisedimenticolia bacterium]|nr:HEAT repeat domain-containing protein [Candidatus Polarisedimenticolia bacterium]
MDPAPIRTLGNDWLKDFCLALKNVSLYSADHPRGREYVDRAYESLRRILESRREVLVTRDGSRLFMEQVILDRDRGLAQQLAEDLASRGIDSLQIHPTLTPEEHLGLIRGLMAKPDRVAEKGGFGQILMDEGVSAVKANTDRGRRSGETVSHEESRLLDLVVQLGRGPERGAPPPPEEDAASASSFLGQDPAAIAQAIGQAARGRGPAGVAGTEALADAVADMLERLAERAIEEHQRDREEILRDLGRAMVKAEPDLHPPLFLDKAGPRSIRKNLVSAVEMMMNDAVADLAAAHYGRHGGDHTVLLEMLHRILARRGDRQSVLVVVEQRLRQLGVDSQDARDLVDQVTWPDLTLPRRVQLLSRGDYLWRADFGRIKEVLLKLLASDQTREATTLIQKYFSGLSSADPGIRRAVADNARHLLQMLEKASKGQFVLGRLTELFFSRLQEEPDAEVVSRLAGALAFLADLKLRSGELRSALDLMRKTEALADSPIAATRERGEKLSEALSRAGSDKIFQKLSQMLLEGSDQASLEAAEILKRGGGRTANHLIERLAEEENRSHRARLVLLLKEMGKGSSSPFLARLDDPRWFLVRNVVGILGDIGDPNVVTHLKRVASHGDPRVRREVVRTFMRLGTPECEDLIIASLADEDRGVQITAVNALATLKGKRSASVLLDLARKSPPFEDVAPEVRQEAFLGLGKLGAAEAVPVLSEVLKKKGFLGRSEPAELRAAAARALGAFGSKEAISLLTDLAQNESKPAVREAAQQALQQRTQAAANPSR